ncbi:hypothetical protein [Bradyrhizobium sp.]|uniref:hypothetical protein n=1 Tax=Bradyrhizobium sp. TaxID=376 RepID=UPI00263372D8|nr:hypothetical protein [Bradyrhizobium sp.]
MRSVPAVPAPARPISVRPGSGFASPTAIVCAALILALVFLAFQIAGGLVAWI